MFGSLTLCTITSLCVGVIVGVILGMIVGVAVSERAGYSVGLSLELFVGITEGSKEGNNVGVAVSDGDGALLNDGNSLGTDVGFKVGNLVGDADGEDDAVGSIDGAAVGSFSFSFLATACSDINSKNIMRSEHASLSRRLKKLRLTIGSWCIVAFNVEKQNLIRMTEALF